MKNFKMKLLIAGICVLMVGGYLIHSSSISNKSSPVEISKAIPTALIENSTEEIAVKINGRNIPKAAIDYQYSSILDEYTKYYGENIDAESIKTYIFNEFIDKALAIDIAKNMDITVSESDLEDTLNMIIQDVGNKEIFIEIISKQGFTPESFNLNIVENLSKERVIKKIQNDDDYEHLLTLARKHIETSNLHPDFVNYMEKVVDEKNGFQITNLDLSKMTLSMVQDYSGDFLTIKYEIDKILNEKTLKAQIAKEKGIEIDETLPFLTQLSLYEAQLIKNLQNSLNPSENDLQEYFQENSIMYDKFPTVSAEIAAVKVDPKDPLSIQENTQTLSTFMEQLKSGILSFENLKDKDIVFKEVISEIGNSGFIPVVGRAPKLAKALFNAPNNDPSIILDGSYLYLFNKIKESSYEEAKYEDVKEYVLKDFKIFKSSEMLDKLLQAKQ